MGGKFFAPGSERGKLLAVLNSQECERLFRASDSCVKSLWIARVLTAFCFFTVKLERQRKSSPEPASSTPFAT